MAKEKNIEKDPNKVSLTSSISFKIIAMVLASMLVLVVVIVSLSVARFKSMFNNLNTSYMTDLAKAYGVCIEATVNGLGAEQALSYDILSQQVGAVQVDGKSSSYAYVVDASGIMLYHPTADKVGNSVENEVVKGLVSDMQSGKDLSHASNCVTYLFKGTMKYASYYVGQGNAFVLIITDDYDEIFANLNRTINLIILIAIVFMAVVITLISFAIGYMLKPIHVITRIINKAAQLDLTKNEGTDELKGRKDEMGVIARAVSNLRHTLVDVMTNLSGQSTTLADTASSFAERFTVISEDVTNVNLAVEEIAQGSTSQAQETTSAGEQVANIGLVIEENAGNVEKLEDTVNEMNRLSDQASETLGQLEQINAQTVETIQIVSDQTTSTHESAAKIQEAVTLIQDIASQTNLLSLNASIEAARAGEAGRGFAVVAEEIRKLADDSAASAEVISQIVGELIENSNMSVEKMVEVSNDAEQQRSGLRSTVTSFDALKKCVEAISVVSRDIFVQTSNLERQKDIISGVVEQLAAISEENAASTEETSASMQDLSSTIVVCQDQTTELGELSAALNSEIAKFKL